MWVKGFPGSCHRGTMNPPCTWEYTKTLKHIALQWRHNGRDGVSNHQPHDCLLNRLFEHRSKKTSKLRVTGLCAENSSVTGEFPAQMASNTGNVSIMVIFRVPRDIIVHLNIVSSFIENKHEVINVGRTFLKGSHSIRAGLATEDFWQSSYYICSEPSFGDLMSVFTNAFRTTVLTSPHYTLIIRNSFVYVTYL